MDFSNITTAGNQYSNTPLHLAAARNRVRVMALYLLHGALVDAQGHYGRTPIVEAAAHACYEATCMLIAQRGNPLRADSMGLCAIDHAQLALKERPDTAAANRVCVFLRSVVALRWTPSERLCLCVSRSWVMHLLACIQRYTAAQRFAHRLPRQV